MDECPGSFREDPIYQNSNKAPVYKATETATRFGNNPISAGPAGKHIQHRQTA